MQTGSQEIFKNWGVLDELVNLMRFLFASVSFHTEKKQTSTQE